MRGIWTTEARRHAKGAKHEDDHEGTKDTKHEDDHEDHGDTKDGQRLVAALAFAPSCFVIFVPFVLSWSNSFVIQLL